MAYDNPTPEVLATGKLNFEGNVIPNAWFDHLRQEKTGKPHTIAIVLLSEIVYWYRPVEKRHEQSGRTIAVQKKFKADLLQKNYADFADKFGYSPKQVREALLFLEEEKGVITTTFRTIQGAPYRMFIGICPREIERICVPIASQESLKDKKAQSRDYQKNRFKRSEEGSFDAIAETPELQDLSREGNNLSREGNNLSREGNNLSREGNNLSREGGYTKTTAKSSTEITAESSPKSSSELISFVHFDPKTPPSPIANNSPRHDQSLPFGRDVIDTKNQDDRISGNFAQEQKTKTAALKAQGNSAAIPVNHALDKSKKTSPQSPPSHDFLSEDEIDEFLDLYVNRTATSPDPFDPDEQPF